MDPKTAESDILTPGSSETAAEIPSDTNSQPALLKPSALVAQMVAAGVWPEPELLEKIVQAGDAAVKPLIAVVRKYPRGWPEEAPLQLAMGLLSVLRPPRAIRELLEIIRRYRDESGEAAAIAVGKYGVLAFEPILEVLRDPAIKGDHRSHAIEAARIAAGNGQAMRTQLAEALRFFLTDAIQRGREENRQGKMQRGLTASRAEADSVTVEADSGATSAVDDPNENQEDSQPDFRQEITYLISDLADLADPSALDLIKTAFDEDLVDKFMVDRESIEAQYRRGAVPVRPTRDWLDFYRERYEQHIEGLNQPLTRPLIPTLRPAIAPSELKDDSPAPAPETIRNLGPKLGRNDPCWCGSGKKYKKCHFGKDGFR